MRHNYVRLLTVAALTGLLSSPASTALMAAYQIDSSGHEQGGHKGVTSGEWLAVWWQGVFATPVEGGRHPLIDGGAFGGNNRTISLGEPVLPLGSDTVTIRATIPPGTHLVVPIITVECSVAEAPPFHGEDEPQLRACANGLLDQVSEPYMQIDGKLVTEIHSYRVETPLFRYGPCRLTTC